MCCRKYLCLRAAVHIGKTAHTDHSCHYLPAATPGWTHVMAISLVNELIFSLHLSSQASNNRSLIVPVPQHTGCGCHVGLGLWVICLVVDEFVYWFVFFSLISCANVTYVRSVCASLRQSYATNLACACAWQQLSRVGKCDRYSPPWLDRRIKRRSSRGYCESTVRW